MAKRKQSEIKAALQRALNHDSPHVQSRAQIILMTLEGQSSEAIAAAVEMSERTVQKWQKAWESDGLNIFPPEVLDDNAPSPAENPAEKAEPEALTENPENSSENPPTPRIELEWLKAPGVLRTDTLAEATRKILRHQFQQVNQYELEIDDAEGLHKMRVAVRRMRSAYRLLGKALGDKGNLPRRLKRTGDTLGRVRDLDVLLIHLNGYIADTLKGDSTPLASLLDLIQDERQDAVEGISNWLADRRYEKFIARLYATLENPIKNPPTTESSPRANLVAQVLPRLIYTQWEAVQRFAPVIHEPDIEMLHELRIEFKHLRYSLEFFEEVLGPSAKTVLKEIKRMQDELGMLNDAEVAINLIQPLQKDIAKAEREGTIAYRKVREAELEQAVASVPAAWEKFNRPEIREALALAVAAI
jgi:CHAD domain-containing protein